MTDYSPELPCAHDTQRSSAVFRATPEDFRVTEELGFELSGDGEHLWVKIEKTDLNTMDVIKVLSESSGVPRRDIGYAGLKDRQAVAMQWFSLKTPKPLALETALQGKVRVLEQTRNSRKLRQGSHKGNSFRITLRNVEHPEHIASQFSEIIGHKGVPNYFGPQRFGNAARNLDHAHALFTGTMKNCSRFQRSIYLSAARAYLFNQVLARRVQDKTWNTFLAGDVMMLAGSSSVFEADAEDAAVQERLAMLDIHPTGPLWGKGDLKSRGDCKALESSTASECAEFASGLEAAGLKQERRALRLVPGNPGISPAGDGDLVVEFSLSKGAYATSVLREMVIAEGL